MKTEIEISDVTLMHQIIDACVKRGAIAANEMIVVGTLFNKLEQILEEEKNKEEPSK
jgi:hypothetical protein